MRNALLSLSLSAASAMLNSACSTMSLPPIEPPRQAPPALCTTLCPPMPGQTVPGTISREDLSTLRAWGYDCQQRQAECIGWIEGGRHHADH